MPCVHAYQTLITLSKISIAIIKLVNTARPPEGSFVNKLKVSLHDEADILMQVKGLVVQTSSIVMLPLELPNYTPRFLVVGGNTADQADPTTPATANTYFLDLSQVRAYTLNPLNPRPTRPLLLIQHICAVSTFP